MKTRYIVKKCENCQTEVSYEEPNHLEKCPCCGGRLIQNAKINEDS